MQELLLSTSAMHATRAGDAIWFCSGGGALLTTRHDEVSFFKSAYCRDLREMRIIALPENARLICNAYQAATQLGFPLYLASPGFLDTRYERGSPELVLSRAMALVAAPQQYPVSLGGWHRMTAGELPFYAASALAQAPATTDEELAAAFRGHPVWRRARFVAPAQDGPLARLLAGLRDPRWFVDPLNPRRSARLYAYVGVGKLGYEGGELRELATAAWLPEGKVAAGAARHPRAFMLRQYLKYDGPEPARARKATRLFLRFLCAIWREYQREERGLPGESLFIPEYFFESEMAMRKGGKSAPIKDVMAPEVAEAYRQYLAQEAGAATTPE